MGKSTKPTTFARKIPGPGASFRATWPITWHPTLTRNTNHAAHWKENNPWSLLPVEGPTPGVVERYKMKHPSKNWQTPTVMLSSGQRIKKGPVTTGAASCPSPNLSDTKAPVAENTEGI